MKLHLQLQLGPGTAGSARLPAPANLSVTEGADTIDFSFDAVPSATEYQYSAGSGWVSLGTSTSATGVSVPYGAGTLSVRALNGTAAGYTASESFNIPDPGSGDSMWTPSGDPMWTPSGSPMWT